LGRIAGGEFLHDPVRGSHCDHAAGSKMNGAQKGEHSDTMEGIFGTRRGQIQEPRTVEVLLIDSRFPET
jgi:hypothetical protein